MADFPVDYDMYHTKELKEISDNINCSFWLGLENRVEVRLVNEMTIKL